MDTLSPEKRSEVMSHIRSKDTKPEMVVRRHLHALGFRFRLHSHKLPGHPDIVLPKWHTVVFVNGCFWHRHKGCKTATMPKSNVEFWQAKFDRNVARDKKEHAALEAAGWHVIVLWECEVKKRLETLPREIMKQRTTKAQDGGGRKGKTAKRPSKRKASTAKG